jgi:hypothetical protein
MPDTSFEPDSGGAETSTEASAGDSSTRETGTDGGASDASDVTTCNHVLPEFVTTNLTLTRACSPYNAPTPVFVGDTTNHPVLTIEPGVTVTFASGAYLSVGMAQVTAAPGGLQAVGTSGSPIVLTAAAANPSAGAWGGVYFNPMADPTSTLSNAVVQYAGQQFAPLLDTPIDLGSIYVDAGTMSPLVNSTPLHIVLSNLTVSHNGGSGIVFFGPYAGFAASSGTLTIPDWATNGYPIVIDPNSADTLPTSLATGTGNQGSIGIIQEEQNTAGGGQNILIHDETWPSIPIPYDVDTSLYSHGSSSGDCGLFIDGIGSATVTLTIASPNTIEFEKPPAGGACGIYVSQNQSGGQIIANGTATAPIAFTSAQATPAPGDWSGITVSSDTTNFGTTSFTYCTFGYGAAATPGTPAGTSELFFDGFPACASGGGPGTQGPSVTHCTFTDYTGCAVNGLDLDGESTTYGTGTTGTNGDVYTPASGTSGVCSETNC